MTVYALAIAVSLVSVLLFLVLMKVLLHVVFVLRFPVNSIVAIDHGDNYGRVSQIDSMYMWRFPIVWVYTAVDWKDKRAPFNISSGYEFGRGLRRISDAEGVLLELAS